MHSISQSDSHAHCGFSQFIPFPPSRLTIFNVERVGFLADCECRITMLTILITLVILLLLILLCH